MTNEKYLREEFTGYIIKLMLEDRISINLIGDKGSGKTRLLEDICNAGLTGVRIVKVDLKAYENSYSGLLREIHRQLGLTGEVSPRLGEIFDGFENHRDKYLILMDNYDALLDNPQVEKGYDVDFFDDLNYIKNKKNISILCATSRPHNALPVFIAGKSYRNSWLDLQKENLPPLDRSQIENELERRLADPVRRRFQENPHERDLLVDAIHEQPYPYARLEFLVKKLNQQRLEEHPLKIKKRLGRWLKELKKQERRGIDKTGHRIRGRIEAFMTAIGIIKILLFLGKIGKIIGLVLGRLNEKKKKTPKPHSGIKLLKWLFFEPIILRKYIYSLKNNKKQVINDFLKTYLYLAFFMTTLWLSINLLIAILDIPSTFSDLFNKEIVDRWNDYHSWFARFFFYSGQTIIYLELGLALGLAVGIISSLIGSLIGGLSLGLTLGLIGSLAFSLSLGITLGIVLGFSVGIAFAVAFDLAFVSADRLVVGLTNGLVVGLTVGQAIGMTSGLITGIGITIGFYLTYFRLFPFYPMHLFCGIFPVTFSHNAYKKDGLIWLPLPGLKTSLTHLSNEQPKEAIEFADFLLEYRILQRTLAMHLMHAAIAGLWQREKFSAEILKQKPIISDDRPKFQPSKEWLDKIDSVRQELVAYEEQSNIGYKIDYFKRSQDQIRELGKLTLRKESARWNFYYFDALKEWQQRAQEEFTRLQLLAEKEELITPNIYRSGEALNPDFDQDIFLGRDDLKDELQHKILSSRQMPLFLIQGQRRVGKSSLLKFLPRILSSHFKLIYLDLQSLNSIPEWLSKIREEFDRALGISSKPLPPSSENDWQGAWKALQTHLLEAAGREECKIILAFDEYEKAHTLFQKNPKESGNMLLTMRNFSQHQDKIVFLFVGSAFFYELEAPDWSSYFVQAERLTIDYLKKEDTLKLIGLVHLDYPTEAPEEIFRLTQGHPALAQKICREMVATANTNNRKTLTMTDLENVLAHHIYAADNPVCVNFWKQFCHESAMKETVKQIIDQKQPGDKKSLFRLKQHGFVIEENESYRMRVPIFAEWVARFGDLID